ncbi:MotA/TolQ/ExbB proton channel family protein [Sedimentitalea sp. JM2-8]|uniref:MotA/TolQ/ExbB proton channel family protein n=2 Tax=Sedimentitalea xiamensis TaxID=3050037 RepID=A0ABT7FH48_9RHOB|nr:MotA/TolQ/ExbB proton channel family protein [Sedimentitalea xiamensis]MDK3074456.1 MotA/TolQ/ExbB proton channel family protein [Sedimentitalea xiamensis]
MAQDAPAPTLPAPDVATTPAAPDSGGGTNPPAEAPPLAGTTAAAGPGAVPETEPSMTDPYFQALRNHVPETLHDETEIIQAAAESSARFLRDGGPAIWAIAALSLITATIILWKIWRLALAGAWSKGHARKAVAAYESGRIGDAERIVDRRRGVRSKVVRSAIAARNEKPDDLAREDTARVARNELADAAEGLRALELISTIAPLLGLLGTVMGMIAAFQALQQSGARADPALLAGGIWEALLTTAAGMAVAIPASAALSWFESVIDRIRRDSEDAVTRIFVAPLPAPYGRNDALPPVPGETAAVLAAAAE